MNVIEETRKAENVTPQTNETSSNVNTLEYAWNEIKKLRFLTIAKRAGFYAVIQDGIPTAIYKKKDFLYACDRLTRALIEDGWNGDYEIRQSLKKHKQQSVKRSNKIELKPKILDSVIK